MIDKLIEKWKREDEDTYHFRVSIAKSAFRVGAGFALIPGFFTLAGICLIVAEILGVVEEL